MDHCHCVWLCLFDKALPNKLPYVANNIDILRLSLLVRDNQVYMLTSK